MSELDVNKVATPVAVLRKPVCKTPGQESSQEGIRVVQMTDGKMGRKRRVLLSSSDDDDDDYDCDDCDGDGDDESEDGEEDGEEEEEEEGMDDTFVVEDDWDGEESFSGDGGLEFSFQSSPSSLSVVSVVGDESVEDVYGDGDGWIEEEEEEEEEERKASPLRGRAFKRERDRLTRELYAEYNEGAFDSLLPRDMRVTWAKRLVKTAGRTIMRRRGTEYSCEIELSEKVLDAEDRLRNTLAHEMCHAAAWLVNHNSKPPHGPVFKTWARAVEAAFPDLTITTCHSYAIRYKYHYTCSSCAFVYGRHSKSIDVLTQRCGKCQGFLVLHVQSDASTPTSSKSHHQGRGVSKVKKKRAPNAFALFVKEHYAGERAANPAATHGDIMTLISAKYKLQKQQQQ